MRGLSFNSWVLAPKRGYWFDLTPAGLLLSMGRKGGSNSIMISMDELLHTMNWRKLVVQHMRKMRKTHQEYMSLYAKFGPVYQSTERH